jgi:hypothetical protein
MPEYTDESRKVYGAPLDNYELSKDKASFGYFVEHNALGRALAHLLGYDGAKSLFLRCDSSGRLRVMDESGGGASDVTIHDPTTVAQKLAVDAAGKIGAVVSGAVTVSGPVNVADPVTPTQKLLVDAAGKVGAVVSGAVTVSGPVNVADPVTPTQKLLVDAAGKVGAVVSGAVTVSGPVNVADPVTPAQKLLVDAAGKVGAVVSGAVTVSGPVNVADAATPAQTLGVDASGRLNVVLSDGATAALKVTVAGGLLYTTVREILAGELKRALGGTLAGTPLEGIRAPDAVFAGSIATSAEAILDLGTNIPAYVVLTLVEYLPQHAAFCPVCVYVWSSTTSGGHTSSRGRLAAGAYRFHATNRYVDMVNYGETTVGYTALVYYPI